MTLARKLFTPLLPILAYGVLRLLQLTLRKSRPTGELPGGPCILAFWHGEQQLLLAGRPKRPMVAMTSASADGQLQAKILKWFGIGSVVGSSSRRAASALLGLARTLEDGKSALMAVDGPRGPRHEAKPGVLQLARATGCPIVPVRATATRSWTLRSTWDGFQLPKPFARVELTYLEPLWVPPETPRKALPELLTTLNVRLGSQLGTAHVSDRKT